VFDFSEARWLDVDINYNAVESAFNGLL
jgi:hypothetical protein